MLEIIMPQNIGMHHLHKRKRIHDKHEPYPHPDRFKNFMDRYIFVVAVIGPLMILPQMLKIWLNKDATSISLITWLGLCIISSSWIIYGLLHKDKPIIVTNFLFFSVQILIVIGTLLYG